MSQRARRRNPYPWTWEPAASVLGILFVVALTGLQTGRTLTNGLTTGHWQLAPPTTWATTALTLLRGDAAAGLDPRPDLAASAAALWLATGAVETVLLSGTVLAVRWGWRRWNPWRPQGFATPAEADRVLGLQRLRHTAHLIRPDLHHQLGRSSR